MPSSNLTLALDAVLLVSESGAKSVLDIGPGNGKYGLLSREYIGPQIERIDCIEAEPTYLERFRWLPCIYDNVYQGDGSDLSEAELDLYDAVMLYDVIEHIDKAKALALIDRIKGHVCIITPVDFFTQHVEGVPSEDHVSHWTLEDFNATGRVATLYTKHGGIICRLGPKS